MSKESATEEQQQQQQQQQQPIRTCKFYGSNFRSPRVYPSKRTTILIDLPESQPFDHSTKSSKHGAARWTLDGLGSKRLRLHGKVEGNLNRLRMDKDDDDDDIPTGTPSSSKHRSKSVRNQVKPPLVGTKRSRYASQIDEEEEEEDDE